MTNLNIDAKDPSKNTKTSASNLIDSYFEEDVNKFLNDMKLIRSKCANSANQEEKLYEEFKRSVNTVLKKGEALIEQVHDRLIQKKIKKQFRDMVAPQLYAGTLMELGFKKPFGYPGDFNMIEVFYDHRLSSSGFVRLWDRHMLSQDYVQAVRDRKDHMRQILESFLRQNDKGPLRILDLGSGSCRELRELNPDLLDKERDIEISLLDQEPKALKFSIEKLKSIHPSVKFRSLITNILDYARHPDKYAKILGSLDLIYCIGLADYLPDDCLKGVIKTSFQLIKSGCQFVIAHKNVIEHKSVSSDWFCDWTFIPRSEEEFVTLIRESLATEKYELSVKRIKAGHVFFVYINKSHQA